MAMERHDERRVMVADREVFVSRLVDVGKDAGYMVKTAPSGTLLEEFFTEDERCFYPMSSSILHSGLMHKTINEVAPITDAGLVLLLRQALAEWVRVVKGYERQLHSLDPVAIRLEQRRVNAPEHDGWGHVTCEACGDTFALGYNRIFGDRMAEAKCVALFEGILAEEHKQGRSHRDMSWPVSRDAGKPHPKGASRKPNFVSSTSDRATGQQRGRTQHPPHSTASS